MTSCYIGQALRLQTTFVDAAGAATDVTATIIVRTPNGTETSYTGGALTHPATGIYYKDYTTAAVGVHFVRYKCTGALTCANEDTFQVLASAMAAP